ncbi:MAG: hypothetical protein ACKO83_14175 [Roseiflexaceae bacterium]
MDAHSPPLYASADILTLLGLDPNQQYIPIRQVLLQLDLNPRTYERALRKHPVLATGLKPLWIHDALGQRLPALCLRVDLMPLWLSTLPSPPHSVLAQWQHEVASVLWQQFKPNGAPTADVYVGARYQLSAIEQAYVQAHETAAVARHQLLGERELDAQVARADAPITATLSDAGATAMVKMTRQTALTSATLSKRNDYLGIFMGLVRVFQIHSLRAMPPARLESALAWLELWQQDLLDAPPPD